MDKCERCGGPLNECSLCGPSRDVAAELLADLILEVHSGITGLLKFYLYLTLSELNLVGALVAIGVGAKGTSVFLVACAVALWPWRDMARLWRTRHDK